MNNDITGLIKRSNELGEALRQRSPTREDTQWSVKIALAGLPENNLARMRWWQRRARMLRST